MGWRGRVPELPSLLARISRKEGMGEEEVREGGRRRSLVRARKVFCRLAVKRMGYSGASVARFLGVTTSLVNRYAGSEALGDLDQYM